MIRSIDFMIETDVVDIPASISDLPSYSAVVVAYHGLGATKDAKRLISLEQTLAQASIAVLRATIPTLGIDEVQSLADEAHIADRILRTGIEHAGRFPVGIGAGSRGALLAMEAQTLLEQEQVNGYSSPCASTYVAPVLNWFSVANRFATPELLAEGESQGFFTYPHDDSPADGVIVPYALYKESEVLGDRAYMFARSTDHPVLVLTGEKDEYVPKQETEAVLKALGSNVVEHHEIKGANHGLSNTPEILTETMQKISAFYTKQLLGEEMQLDAIIL